MTTLKTILVGAGGMGGNQARILGTLPDYDLTAIVDLRAEAAEALAAQHGARAYADLAEALAAERPDVVAICTANTGHAGPCIQAATFGVRGIYCEKPMAVDLADARAMVATCEAHGTKLVINHQRRTGADLRAMKAAIDAGAIGQVRRIRCQNAGDLLSDGTHAIDSLLYLVGDAEVEWLMGQIHREQPAADAGDGRQEPRPGWRYGHPVEDGSMAEIQFAGGIRGEVMTGSCRDECTAYQHYEVTGTQGSLLRCGDAKQGEVTVFIDDGRPGTHALGFDQERWVYRPLPAASGRWRALQDEVDPTNLIAQGYSRLAAWIDGGPEHPMSGRVGLRDMELVTGIYESARLGRRLTLPITQETFPLALMIDAHQSVAV